jgi:asparagine synthase (glutamine-hydrolysing)
MCGIAGLVDPQHREPPAALLQRVQAMAAQVAHRGPDDSGAWVSPDGVVGLSHRRLSIIDLSTAGRGPMHSADERLTITFNGEIYNFLELRDELRAAGYRFRSDTDTEVVLAAYDRWGAECLQRFVGMFAFGLWDARARSLLLARDRLGKKPLYYTFNHGRLAFASELKPLLVSGECPRTIDPEALSLYLRYGYVPSPYAIFQAARKLPPAHYAVLQGERLELHQYWDPIAIALAPADRLGDEEAKEQFTALLRDSVKHRLISDVPLGMFLSGGMDSSLLAAITRDVSDEPVKTFTIRFQNPEYNEADQAAAVARHVGSEHHEATCGTGEMLQVVDRLGELLDEPFADSSVVPTYLVSKMTRGHVTVALSGDGGDELFFGYPRYHVLARYGWLAASPRLVRHAVAAAVSVVPRRRFRRAGELLRQDTGDAYSRFIAAWTPAEVSTLTGRAALDNPVYRDARRRLASLTEIERLPLVDLVTYLPEDILTKVDRASMAVGLEARAPLLDHRIVEFSLRLPLDMKWRGGVGKWLLRAVAYDRIPQKLLDRPKMGFGVPLHDWFRGPLRERMTVALEGSALQDLGLAPESARELWRQFLAGRAHRTDAIWSLFALMSWAERWWGGKN